MARGLAASSPLTWDVVLRLPGAGRDHVEDLGGASVGGAVGPLGDAGGQPGPRCAGDVAFFILTPRSLRCYVDLASQSSGDKHKKWFYWMLVSWRQVKAEPAEL